MPLEPQDYHVSLSDFLDGVEMAFVRAYLDDDESRIYERNWHPDDLAINLSVIIESIGAYSSYVIRERAIERNYGRLSPGPEMTKKKRKKDRK
jgi:hypothetical protein